MQCFSFRIVIEVKGQLNLNFTQGEVNDTFNQFF